MIRDSIQEFLTDNCTHLSAAISYYLLLSLFPLALAAIFILSFISRSPNVAARVTQAITDMLPVSGKLVADIISGVAEGWGAVGAIAVIGLLWSGTGVFNAIRKSLNTAWGIKTPRSFFLERFMELIMMLGFGMFVLVSVGITTAAAFIQDTNTISFGGQLLSGGLLGRALVIVASTAVTFVGFLFLYKFVPNTRVRWRYAWVGALIAAVLFELVKNVFVWFVGKFSNYNLVYGSIGTIIVLMTWTYASSVILLFCAKVISTYARMKAKLLMEAPTMTIAAGDFEAYHSQPNSEELKQATPKKPKKSSV